MPEIATPAGRRAATFAAILTGRQGLGGEPTPSGAWPRCGQGGSSGRCRGRDRRRREPVALMPYRRRCTFGPVVSAGALGVIAASMLAAGGLSLGPTRIVAAARVSSALSTGTLPLTRVIGINLGGGQAGPETPLSAVPAEFSDLATNLHVTWVRYDFSWWNVCPPAQACNWTTADTIMQDAAQTGLGIVAILGSPYWPSSTPVLPTASQWTAYVTAFTQRYDAVWKPEGLRGLVIEPWNEPENNWFSGAAAWATQIQLPAYQAVKAVDPSVLVAMATTDWASGGQSWWQQVASALSGQPFVDLPGYHDYANSTDSWNPSFRAFLASHGVAYKAVWATEFGAGMTPPAPFDDTAHINVLQSQIPPVLNGASVDGLFYYAYKDLAEGGAVHESYGLMDEYGNHYQSYSVFQQLMEGITPPLAPTPAPTPPPPSSPSVSASPAPSMPVATTSASPSATAGTAPSTPTAGDAGISAPSQTPAPALGSTQPEAGSGRRGGTGVPLAVPLGIAALVVVGGGLVAIGLVPGLRRWPPTLRS